MGRIADRGAEHVGAREWMRICFELLELLKAHKKAIRRATVNTFGYIAKAIGWVWVLVVFCSCRRKKVFLNIKGYSECSLTVLYSLSSSTSSSLSSSANLWHTLLRKTQNEYWLKETSIETRVSKVDSEVHQRQRIALERYKQSFGAVLSSWVWDAFVVCQIDKLPPGSQNIVKYF